MCWGPYVILNFWSVNNETKPIPYSADLFTTLLAFANSCVNPVLFVLLNKDFRRRVRMLGRKLMPCLGHRQPSDATDNGLSAVHTRLEADDAMMRSQEREVARRAEPWNCVSVFIERERETVSVERERDCVWVDDDHKTYMNRHQCEKIVMICESDRGNWRSSR
ncbi:hypothetical protein C0Q70_16869 [Pomacea canaliculata]|uniref:G-protein coupled receptors family 1 profile domain-containing protein n=1 Tax=Pomacea canaliculata TaxID=400727 RepID=A0A2T7NQZ7_POMCA|nr:hypothetical protein C0Q70_16869 [Pomacea canaliculata]